MKFVFAIICGLVMVQIQSTNEILGKPIHIKPCDKPCPKIKDPVCGKDHKTYQNECLLNHAKVELKHKGRCVLASECPINIWCDPQCGKDGNTYCGDCGLEAAGVVRSYRGDCVDCKKPCPKDGQEVCGVDNKQYKSIYHLICKAKVEWKNDGKCEKEDDFPARCPKIYLPVCGSDKITYGNSCLAEAAGIKKYYPGRCLDCKKKCPKEYTPVCASNGLTQKNLCELICRKKLDFVSDGRCPVKGCRCMGTIDKVCGIDGVIYRNPCVALCSSIDTQNMKYCKKEDDKDCKEIEIGSTN